MRLTKRLVPAVTLAALIALSGCGSGEKTVPSAKLAGSVKLDGQPLAAGSITFVPADGKTPSSGGVIKDGKYTATVPLGSMKVKITSPKVVGQRATYPDSPNSPKEDVVEETVPKEFNTETTLSRDVQKDTNDLNFDLTAQPAH